MRRARDERVKQAVLDAYGRSCACCGETEPAFLTLDHVRDDGAADRAQTWGGKSRRSGVPFYRQLRALGFPNDGRYQILCANCQLGKRLEGGCPHATRKTGE